VQSTQLMTLSISGKRAYTLQALISLTHLLNHWV
jgi:hypothetical protein